MGIKIWKETKQNKVRSINLRKRTAGGIANKVLDLNAEALPPLPWEKLFGVYGAHSPARPPSALPLDKATRTVTWLSPPERQHLEDPSPVAGCLVTRPKLIHSEPATGPSGALL